MTKRLLTSESVTSGHPDKVCDCISDAVVDDALRQDPESRVAVEVMAAAGNIYIAGEMTTKAWVDVQAIARDVLVEIGYDNPKTGLDGRTCGVNSAIQAQSPDIAAGVDRSWEARQQLDSLDAYDLQGAGDQGIMFGYACDETQDYMPLPLWLSHRLATRLEQVRREQKQFGLYPDGKTQVTAIYEDGQIVGLDTIIVSTQHRAGKDMDELSEFIAHNVVNPVLGEDSLEHLDTRDLRLIVNPAGPFVQGGPQADTGLTGRKIIVDTYGGRAHHGGGAFSGKDPSKVDRSAAYATRWAAKNVVAAGLAKECEIQIAYAIGKARPVSINVETFGTGDNDQVRKAISEVFDFRPAAIIKHLDLKRPIYRQTAAYGHFGRECFPWEQLNRVAQLRKFTN